MHKKAINTKKGVDNLFSVIYTAVKKTKEDDKNESSGYSETGACQ